MVILLHYDMYHIAYWILMLVLVLALILLQYQYYRYWRYRKCWSLLVFLR